MDEKREKIRELPLSTATENPGFSVGRFRYNEGFSLNEEGAPAYSIAFPHRHPHFEIFWFSAGYGRIERDCDLIAVEARTLLILGPGDVHTWRETRHLEGSLLAVSEAFTSGSNFSLPFRELTAFLQPNGSRSLQLSQSEDNLIRNVFEIIRDKDTQSNFDQGEVLKALLLILFSKIRGFYVGRGAQYASSSGNLLTRDFKQALLTECPRLGSVKEFADHLRVSRSYLHRTVLHDTGAAPSDLIRDRVVFEAKRMLLHTASTTTEIAEHLGFRSASYFSSFFQRHTKQSPREYRSSRAS
jgi:AraC-like DNA-binding protein